MATDGHGPGVQLVALVASAGGLEALSTVLRDLPLDFPAAVVVQQHLGGGHNSVLPAILCRQTGHSVHWAQDGQVLIPGQVVVCPPGMQLELTPKGRCRLYGAQQRQAQFDALLASVARSYGPRGIAAVLSGSGHDGAAGTVAMKRAGALVIAESPATARYTSMPIAAARAGADLVLRVDEIGNVLAGIIGGAPLPVPRESHVDGAALPQMSPTQKPVDPGGAAGSPVIFGQLSLKYRTDSAAARCELARLRVAELQRRRQDLIMGLGATQETVALARWRAEESRCRAQLADRAAKEASARREHQVPGHGLVSG